MMLAAAAPLQAAITLSYESYELCEDLVVNFELDLRDGVCVGGFDPTCTYEFSGNVHIRSGGVDVISPWPFTFSHTLPVSTSGPLLSPDVVIPAASLSGLTLGNSYDIVIGLTFVGIPTQATGGTNVSVFSPCFSAFASNAGPTVFNGPPCFLTVDNFTYSPVSADFIWQQQTTFMCSWPGGCQVVNSLTVRFEASSDDAATYAWYVNNVLVPGANSYILTYPFPACGSYTVRLDITAAQCPQDSYSETIYVGNSPFCTDSEGPCCGTQRVGNTGNGPHIELDILPNPASSAGKLMLRYALPTSDNVRIAIHDIQGQAVLDQTDYQEAGSRQHILVLPELPGGIYQLVLTAGDTVVYRKMIVQ